jgi:hypothetical protein
MISRHIGIPKQMNKLKDAIDRGEALKNTEEQLKKDVDYERFVKIKMAEKELPSGDNSPIANMNKNMSTKMTKLLNDSAYLFNKTKE